MLTDLYPSRCLSLTQNTDTRDSRKAERCCLSGNLFISPTCFRHFISGAGPIHTRRSRLEPVRFGPGSVGSVANISTASNNDEQYDFGKEPCPATTLLVSVGGLTGALASLILSAR